MKKLHFMAIVALFLLGLSGCEKAKVQNQASADVFVKAIKNAQGATVYTAMHSVFSYNKMASVSVKYPGGTTMQLTDPENLGNSFYNQPADADYSATAPAVGNYTYTVKFDDGEEITYNNSLAASILAPAIITSLVKSAKGDSVYISWDAITGTHAYQMKVELGTNQVYLQPAFADGSVPPKASLKLGVRLANFSSSAAGTYTFSLTGLLFESTAYDYIQAISVAKKDIAL